MKPNLTPTILQKYKGTVLTRFVGGPWQGETRRLARPVPLSIVLPGAGHYAHQKGDWYVWVPDVG